MNYDAIVIGFGQGANAIVADLAANDWKVALIEKNEHNYGGSCINIGCIPTKILEHDAREGADYKQAVQRRNEVTQNKRQSEKEAMENNKNVDLYTGAASFVDNHTVQVEMAEETVELTSDYITISTGSEPVIPPVEGLKDIKNVYTSTTLQEEEKLPRKLGIIGGGNIGIEFSSIYSTYGSEVTIVDNSDNFMEGEEPEVAAEVKNVLEGKGIKIYNGTTIEKVKNEDETILATTNDGKEFEFDALLVATGRKPHISSLNLDRTDIELTDNKGIKVDSHLKTSVDGVYALGDAKGGPQFTYITTNDAQIVLSDLLGDGESTLDQRQRIPHSVFMDPPFAQVGLTEKQAKDEGYNILTNTAEVGKTVRASVINDYRGLYKAVVDKDTKKVLGATLFGDQAHELVNFVKLVMDQDLSYTVFRDQMFTHPVMTEIFNTLFDI